MRAAERQVLIDLLERSPGRVLNKWAVVEAAKPKASPLHHRFTWDKTAGWRKNLAVEARALISEFMIVVMNEQEQPIKIREFISLRQDRVKGGGGGHRLTLDILNDEQKMEAMLQDALAEFECFQAKWQRIKQLAPIFAAGDRVREQVKRKKAA